MCPCVSIHLHSQLRELKLIHIIAKHVHEVIFCTLFLHLLSVSFNMLHFPQSHFCSRLVCISMNPCTDVRRHRKRPPHDTAKYGLLFAAQAGCIQCVKYWIESVGVDINSTSDNHDDWDVESYAKWGNSIGKDSVLKYLQDRRTEVLHLRERAVPNTCLASSLSHSSQTEDALHTSPLLPKALLTSYMVPCRGVHLHGISHKDVDRLAGAAWDGCLTCVSHLITAQLVSPDEKPGPDAPFQMTARDAALYGAALERHKCFDVLHDFEDTRPEAFVDP